MPELEKRYEPHAVEERWYSYWFKKNYFQATLTEDKPFYSIVIPPPNVTGSLHIGHAFNNTLQDILIRWRRMHGDNVLWMPGTDHAGIATQNVVERQLKTEGLHRDDLGREKFIERVWRWREESGGVIIDQLKRLGASCDWGRERFTMDEGLSRAVREVFVRLYHEGLIYQGDYIINWCPRCRTALSDIEVEYQEVQGNFYHIKYPIANGYLVVATTRPETMLGDTALAVHPDDERYRHLVGQEATLPVIGRRLKIIADTYVDKEFGTGVVKITPAHDPNDFLVGQRHNLERVLVMREDGTMNENAGPFAGQDRFTCRKNLVEQLKQEGLLEKVEPHPHTVGHCYRCQTVVEPYLSKQWFVAMKILAAPALDVVRKGEIRFTPPAWEKTYYEWLENIRDWCISRQIWWGHRIPAWHCQPCGHLTVSVVDVYRCEKCHSEDIEQETDVLDTWFSSALWPFSTLGWPEETPELKHYYPTSVLVTGFDILFFWVARMIMMGLKFLGKVPFHEVYIHALIRDAEGNKMSKSRGNVIDPLVMIDKYGTDALRFTLTAFAAQGRDICLSEQRIEGYRNFCNKIWNAARFILMHLGEFNWREFPESEARLELADRWIISRYQRTIGAVEKALQEYNFNEAAHCLYDFIWHEFCDWYLEIVKSRLNGEDRQAKETALYVLAYIMEGAMRLLHPIMPFITEEIWQHFSGGGTSVMVSPYPQVDPALLDEAAEEEMGLLQELITKVRNLRSEMAVPQKALVRLQVKNADEAKQTLLSRNLALISNLAKVEDVAFIPATASKPSQAATFIVRTLEIYVPLGEVIDFAVERERQLKEMAKVQESIERSANKLAREDFIKNARAEVVTKERDNLARNQEILAKLQENLAQLQ